LGGRSVSIDSGRRWRAARRRATRGVYISIDRPSDVHGSPPPPLLLLLLLFVVVVLVTKYTENSYCLITDIVVVHHRL